MGENGKKITIQDVAFELGVSKTTVSRAISGKGRVGEATRKRVLAYIEQFNYVPNAMAKGLAQSRTYNIGLAVPEDFALVDLPFFQKCLMGISKCAGEADYDVVISMVSGKDASSLERMVKNRKVDGVIVTRTLVDDEPVRMLKSFGIPFVTIGSCDDDTVVQIDNDHETACGMLTSILLKRGIGKVALLCGDESHVVTRNRKQGFLNAVEEAGIKGTSRMIFDDTNGSKLDKAVDTILDEEYDCILCMDDSICVRVLDKLKKEEINVPEDIQVASFYNSSVLERNTPSITSLKFDAFTLGETATKILLDKIAGREVNGRTLLGYEISLKESTKL